MNPAKPVVLCFILVFFSITASRGEPTSYLPAEHRAYDFLERMEHHFFVSGTGLGTKPLTRAEVARLLVSLPVKSGLMTGVDKNELQCLLDEF